MSVCEIGGRFGGVERLYGRDAFAWIREAHFCVVGIGGVGSWAVEALARMGVGGITLIDHDDICPTNVNRQIHAITSTLGRSKVEVMRQRVLEINPECHCHAEDDFLTLGNMERHLGRGYDYVIDAIDAIKFKAAMIHHCKRNKIPIITTGGAGGLTDPTAVEVADLAKTFNDPLAAKVRHTLRRHHRFTTNPKRRFGVDCVFSSQQPIYPKQDGSVGHEKPGVHGVTLDCASGYGASSAVTSVFGFVAVAKAVERMVERRRRLAAEGGDGVESP